MPKTLNKTKHNNKNFKVIKAGLYKTDTDSADQREDDFIIMVPSLQMLHQMKQPTVHEKII